MDNTTAEGGTLVRIEVVTSKFTTGHSTNGVNEVATVKIIKPVLVRVVCVGAMVEV